MSGEPDPQFIVARSVLLDALEALGSQRKAIILVGAQAVYLHTGAIELAVAEFTTDADITLDPADKRSFRVVVAVPAALMVDGTFPGDGTGVPARDNRKDDWRFSAGRGKMATIEYNHVAK